MKIEEHNIGLIPFEVVVRTLSVDATIAEHGLPNRAGDQEKFDKFFAETVEKTKVLLKPSVEAFVAGLRVFIDKQPQEAARKVARKVEKAMREENMEALRSFTGADFDVLFEAALVAYEKEDLENACAMLTAIAWVFPMRASVYVLLATIEWRRSGAEKALEVYAFLTRFLEDPILDYHAADCFAHCGNKDRAHELLCRAEENCLVNMQPEEQDTMLEAIRELRNTLNHTARQHTH